MLAIKAIPIHPIWLKRQKRRNFSFGTISIAFSPGRPGLKPIALKPAEDIAIIVRVRLKRKKNLLASLFESFKKI
jgi:hypothetical protein